MNNTTLKLRIEHSQDDNSVNFIDSSPESGHYESRYVRRGEDYFIVYLSVQSACNLGCRMCHLTATRQKKMIENSEESLLMQAQAVLNHYQELVKSGKEKPAKYMHFNFMARGEVLNAPIFKDPNTAFSLLSNLRGLSESIGLNARFLLSTIMPNSFKEHSLEEIFKIIHPYFYYSLYSVNDDFRKKWLPMAMPPKDAINKFVSWNGFSEYNFKIHYAFIEGENDSPKDIYNVCRLLLSHGLKPDVNIVRYNPYSPEHGQEPNGNIIRLNANKFRELLGSNVKIIDRVGKDVKASCGMFIEK
jgi:adenine C2-methylase RlmN of 23S rRNA A2503 and tRNA A37